MDSLAVRVQAEQIAASVVPAIGRPVLESDVETVQKLLAALTDGNYLQVACRVAGISPQTYYNAKQRAEAGSEAAKLLMEAVEIAQSQAEADIVSHWRKAVAAGPQYWAAGATFLERRAPDRWGKRQDDTSTPKVVVQIGTGSGDVQIHVSGADAATPNIIDTQSAPIDVTPVSTPTYSETAQVTERALSDAATRRVKVAATGKTARKAAPGRGRRRGNRAGGSTR